MKKDSLTDFRGSVALLIHWIWTSSLQNCESIHFCSLKPPTLRSFLRQSWGTYMYMSLWNHWKQSSMMRWYQAAEYFHTSLSRLPALSYGSPRQEQKTTFGALKTSWTWAFFRKLASLVRTASHFHYYTQCLVADVSVQSRLHILWYLFFLIFRLLVSIWWHLMLSVTTQVTWNSEQCKNRPHKG